MRVLLILLITFTLGSARAQRPYYYSAQKVDSMNKKSYILFDKYGNRITNLEFDWIVTNNIGWILGLKDRQYRIYDSTGRYIGIDSIQSMIEVWSSSTLIPLKRGGYWGFYSKDGKLKIKHQYDDVTIFKWGKAAVKSNGKIFYIDTSGLILPEKYTESEVYTFEKTSTLVGLFGFSNWAQEKFMKDNKVGLIEKATGKILIDPVYDGMYSISKDNVVVKQSNKFGVVNFSGKIIIPIEYNMIYLLD